MVLVEPALVAQLENLVVTRRVLTTSAVIAVGYSLEST